MARIDFIVVVALFSLAASRVEGGLASARSRRPSALKRLTGKPSARRGEWDLIQRGTTRRRLYTSPIQHIKDTVNPSVDLDYKPEYPPAYNATGVPSNPEAARTVSGSNGFDPVEVSASGVADIIQNQGVSNTPRAFRGQSCLEACMNCDKARETFPSCACTAECTHGSEAGCKSPTDVGWTRSRRVRSHSAWKATCDADGPKKCSDCITESDKKELARCGDNPECLARMIHEIASGDHSFFCYHDQSTELQCTKFGYEAKEEDGWNCFRTRNSCEDRVISPDYDSLTPNKPAPVHWYPPGAQKPSAYAES